MLACSARARAEQFIVTDVAYTHSAATTSDSHYRVDPLPAAPSNWKSPLDYSQGSVHVLLEVKTKPGATPTKFQICFEGTPSYACTDQSRAYTEVGPVEWTTPFTNFYQGDGVGVDWSKGVKKVALILKDTMNNKPQGDPLYVPTDLRVEVAVISKGASYMAPPRDAGVSDAGAGAARDAGAEAGDASAAQPADAATDTRPLSQDASYDAGPSPRSDAGSAAPTAVDASTHAAGDAAGATAPETADDTRAGCALTRGADAASGGWLILASALLVVLQRRRTKRPVTERRRADAAMTF
jgi:hypothetical protein